MLTVLSPGNQVATPTGRYGEFLAALTHADPEQRPRTASIALQMLRQIGVPPGTPWASDPETPEVFDQLDAVPPPQVHHGPASGGGPASCVPASGGGPGSYDPTPPWNRSDQRRMGKGCVSHDKTLGCKYH